MGKLHYASYNATHVPDYIKVQGKPELGEVKHYSQYSRVGASAPASTTFHGAAYAMGNTEEILKRQNLGSHPRGHAAEGPFNHTDGSGHVPGNMDKAFYRDAIVKRKARLHLLVHENSGCMSPYGAKRLRLLGREADANGTDNTDYHLSHTARTFVTFHAQRMSNDIIMHGAEGILKGADKMRCKRLRRASAGADAAAGPQ